MVFCVGSHSMRVSATCSMATRVSARRVTVAVKLLHPVEPDSLSLCIRRIGLRGWGEGISRPFCRTQVLAPASRGAVAAPLKLKTSTVRARDAS